MDENGKMNKSIKTFLYQKRPETCCYISFSEKSIRIKKQDGKTCFLFVQIKNMKI